MSSRITWNSKTLDFPRVASKYQPSILRATQRNVSVSGRQETLNARVDVFVDLEFRGLLNGTATHATFKRNFKQFLMWAQAGSTWYFAWDSTEQVLTTLTSARSAGGTTVQLADTTGIDVNGL